MGCESPAGAKTCRYWMLCITFGVIANFDNQHTARANSEYRVIGAIIAQLIQLEQLRTSKDATFDYWRYGLSTQIVQCSSVITVCAPSIKTFLTSIESGMIQTGHFQLRATPTSSDSSSASRTANRQASSTAAKRHNGIMNFDQFSELNEHSLVSRNIAVVEFGDDVIRSDGVSRSSEAQTIKKTTEWRVDYDTQGATV